MSHPVIRMYYSISCANCFHAEELLNQRGVTDIQKLRVDQSQTLADEMFFLLGRVTTTPQIFIGDYHVGGWQDLVAHDRDGRLANLLAEGQDPTPSTSHQD